MDLSNFWRYKDIRIGTSLFLFWYDSVSGSRGDWNYCLLSHSYRHSRNSKVTSLFRKERISFLSVFIKRVFRGFPSSKVVLLSLLNSSFNRSRVGRFYRWTYCMKEIWRKVNWYEFIIKNWYIFLQQLL